MKRIILLLPVLLLAGCTGRTISNIGRALAKDPATVVAQGDTLYGKFKLVRVGGQTNTETIISSDGTVTVKTVKP